MNRFPRFPHPSPSPFRTIAHAKAVRPPMPSDLDRDSTENQWFCRALHDVAPPPGLTERMLAAVEQARAATEQASIARPAPAPHHRRRVAAGIAAAAIAATLLLSAGLYLARAPALSVASMDQAAAQALEMAGRSPDWAPNVDAVEAKYPWRRWLVTAPYRWRPTTVSGDAGVIYDLVGSEDGGAILLVVRSQRDLDLPTSPTPHFYSSGGPARPVSWKQPGLVYVLATSGALDKPEHFLKAQKFALVERGRQALASR